MSADLSAVAASLRTERAAKADVAQLAERVLGKDEVTSSILVIGSSLRSAEVWSDKVPDEGELRLGKPVSTCRAKAVVLKRRARRRTR